MTSIGGTWVGYKLVRVRRDGSLGPLFINRRQRIPEGRWLRARAHRTPGYAFRPGWHCTLRPEAPHLTAMRDRVWVEVSMRGVTLHNRPACQGGTWALAREIRIERVLWPHERAEMLEAA